MLVWNFRDRSKQDGACILTLFERFGILEDFLKVSKAYILSLFEHIWNFNMKQLFIVCTRIRGEA